MYPYVHYLRVLDLRDLHELLDDDKFRGKIYSNFFTGSVKQFDFIANANVATGTRMQRFRARGTNLRASIAAIGDQVVANAPMLEELTEPSVGEHSILAPALPRWASQLGRLQSIELWDGKTLGYEKIRNLLHAHCPHLRRISVYQWSVESHCIPLDLMTAHFFNRRDDKADGEMATFIRNMPQNALTDFENHAECGIGPETCLAFRMHSTSLAALTLALPEEGISSLGLLQSCTNIEKLKLTDLRPPHDLQATQNDVFLDMISWLKECTKLREISLMDFVSAPAILTPVLNSDHIQLEDLQINARDECMYVLRDHRDFHLAIGKQKRLRSLLLKADPEPLVPDERDILVKQICQLKDLRYLKLTKISEYFQDRHVHELSENLLMLEDLLVAGWGLGDACLKNLSNMGNLKTVTFNGISTFTADGLLEFIDSLSPGNQGLGLSIDSAATETALTTEAQELIRETLMNKVQGRFEYQLFRGMLRIATARRWNSR